jgi:transposase InsO family protein
MFRGYERGLVVVLAGRLKNWKDALLLVKPETILRWHRAGFRLLWRWRSRQRTPPPRLGADVVALIGRMAKENVRWGAERIRGELLKLGIRVAKRTVQRYMRGERPHVPHSGQSWRTFLSNHTVWACDFLQTYDLRFRLLFAFFIVDIHTKRVVDVAVTRAPTEMWTAQQLRNAKPFGEAAELLIRDRDSKYGATFDRVARGAGIRVVKTAVQAPRMNATCERFLGSVRRECLDHLLILGERHLHRVLREYVISYFNVSRPHQGLDQRIPVARERAPLKYGGRVVAIPVLGGLHHDYTVAA